MSRVCYELTVFNYQIHFLRSFVHFGQSINGIHGAALHDEQRNNNLMLTTIATHSLTECSSNRKIEESKKKQNKKQKRKKNQLKVNN